VDRNLVTVLRHEIRGFKDRKKALVEVITALKAKDAGYRRSAERIILRDYKLKKLRAELSDADAAAFWARVDAAVDVGLAE
jgi:hypothetical protein